MIEYHYMDDFVLDHELMYTNWLNRIAKTYALEFYELCYIFCGDDYLLDINRKYLKHNTLTDVITFDYGSSSQIIGDVYVSIDQVMDNSGLFEVPFEEELNRVMAHGLLHLMGYKDKDPDEVKEMRKMESRLLDLFHVEQKNK